MFGVEGADVSMDEGGGYQIGPEEPQHLEHVPLHFRISDEV